MFSAKKMTNHSSSSIFTFLTIHFPLWAISVSITPIRGNRSSSFPLVPESHFIVSRCLLHGYAMSPCLRCFGTYLDLKLLAVAGPGVELGGFRFSLAGSWEAAGVMVGVEVLKFTGTYGPFQWGGVPDPFSTLLSVAGPRVEPVEFRLSLPWALEATAVLWLWVVELATIFFFNAQAWSRASRLACQWVDATTAYSEGPFLSSCLPRGAAAAGLFALLSFRGTVAEPSTSSSSSVSQPAISSIALVFASSMATSILPFVSVSQSSGEGLFWNS